MPLIIRKAPENLNRKDLFLFKHELKRELRSPVVVERRGVFINSSIHFSEEIKADEILSQQALFFKFNLLSLCARIIKFQVSLILREHAIITDSWSIGYFHWLMDCLPRLLLLKTSGINLPLILPSELKKHSYVKESLLLLGESDFCFLKNNRWYFAKKICFPSHLAPTGNYDDTIMQKLRTVFTKGCEGEVGLKAYISRSKSSRRKIANEDEILPVLNELGFIKIYCEDLTFMEQVNFFSKVKYLVSNHGAGLSNILFMSEETKMLEFRRENDTHNNCYFSLASSLQIKYFYQNCATAYSSDDLHNADIIVNKEVLSWNLKLMGVEK